VVPMLGLPPYARFGNWLIISLAATTLAAILISMRRSRT
jgi:apolipoprotein N-acyltransferase